MTNSNQEWQRCEKRIKQLEEAITKAIALVADIPVAQEDVTHVYHVLQNALHNRKGK